jgi:hypothetical protein
MNIHISNIQAYLKTLSPVQLHKELDRVNKQYTPAQTRHMPETSLQSWDKHLELIEQEIELRERQKELQS